MPQVNWDEGGGAAPVYDTGTYTIKITEVERGESYNKKTPQLEWKGVVLEPESKKGRPINDYTYLTDRAMFRVVNMIAGCGVDITSLPAMDTESSSFNKVIRACVGRITKWDVVKRTDDDGKERNSVEAMHPYEDQEPISLNHVHLEDDEPDFLKE